MIDKSTVICASCTAVSSAATAVQVNDVFFTVQLVISILCGVGTLLTIAINLIARIKEWHKKAMEDGKITKEEKEELKQIISDDGSEMIKVVKDTIDNLPKKEDK